MKLINKNKQKPTTEPKRELSSCTERSQRYWDLNFMIFPLKKNGKLINCYQSNLSYNLLIFLWCITTLCCGGDIFTALNLVPLLWNTKWTKYGECYYMTLNQFLWWHYDTYWLTEKILHIQQNGSFVAERKFMKFSKGCISYELTLHLPALHLLYYNFVAS